jgi:hypothetical protein
MSKREEFENEARIPRNMIPPEADSDILLWKTPLE